MKNVCKLYSKFLIATLICCCECVVLWGQTPQMAIPDTLPPINRRERKLATGRSRTDQIIKTNSTTIEEKKESKKEKVLSDSLTNAGDSVKNTIADSTQFTVLTDSLIQKALSPRKTDNYQPDPIRSMWLALVFPGGGQIYNRRYWKLPIVYGGFLGCAYALTWNNQMLRDYQQAYLDIMDTDPNTKSYEQMLPFGYDITGKEERFKNIFKNKKNYYRKYRDMSIFAFAGVYLISVIDAYVDAELSTFDLDQDLSLNFRPSFIQIDQTTTKHYRNIPALSCQLEF